MQRGEIWFAAGQYRCSSGLSDPGDEALVQGAPAPQPSQLGTDEPLCNQVAPPCPPAESIPERALQRSYPRRKPSEVVPHAGVCAGSPARAIPTEILAGSISQKSMRACSRIEVAYCGCSETFALTASSSCSIFRRS